MKIDDHDDVTMEITQSNAKNESVSSNISFFDYHTHTPSKQDFSHSCDGSHIVSLYRRLVAKQSIPIRQQQRLCNDIILVLKSSLDMPTP